MATPTPDGVAVSATLSSTTVDTVQITGAFRSIEVANRAAAGGTDIWFSVGLGAAAGAVTPSAAAAGCFWLPANSTLTIEVIDADEDPDVDKFVKLIGNGNAYTVSGVDR